MYEAMMTLMVISFICQEKGYDCGFEFSIPN